jgi:hypothetical protein
MRLAKFDTIIIEIFVFLLYRKKYILSILLKILIIEDILRFHNQIYNKIRVKYRDF